MMQLPRWAVLGIMAIIAAAVLAYSLGSGKDSDTPVSSATSSATPRAEAHTIPLSREAMFYEKLANNRVRCTLCFRNCVIRDGQQGFCRNRENKGGALYSRVYSRPSAIHVDPVEKEPQHHFLPGSMILCIGTAGCNYRCKFCHNWHLSQRDIQEMRFADFTPEQAVKEAKDNGIPTISFTYNEPTVLYEYVYDTAKLAKEHDVRIMLHSNGSMNPEPLARLLPYVDAITIDLKGFTEEYYSSITEGELAPVLENLKAIKEAGVWLEIVNLMVTGLNDDAASVRAMCRWIKENLGPDVPLHFSRFFPNYRLADLSPTPIAVLERSFRIAREEGLHYVSIGNVPGHTRNSTFCPSCNKRLIDRHHFSVRENSIVDGKCPSCSTPIAGVWK